MTLDLKKIKFFFLLSLPFFPPLLLTLESIRAALAFSLLFLPSRVFQKVGFLFTHTHTHTHSLAHTRTHTYTHTTILFTYTCNFKRTIYHRGSIERNSWGKIKCMLLYLTTTLTVTLLLRLVYFIFF